MLPWIQSGGVMMWPIVAISLVAATIFIQRLFHLHRAQMKSKAGDFLKGIFNVLARGKGLEPDSVVEAISICESASGPVAQMTRSALLEIREGTQAALLAMERTGMVEIVRMERNLGLLLTLAQMAPMCGLLGTVLGLLNMLGAIMQKAPLVHAGDLGAGMWQALIATAAGLMVAIPTYAGYNLLVSRVEMIVLDMERAFVEVQSFMLRLNEKRERA
jgi:biopolymer transport protein ExbB